MSPTGTVTDMNTELASAIEAQGFDLNDCPYTPILAEWENFPIVVAIRFAEVETGLPYIRPAPAPG